jgi:diguanylate cyclase (GGDEF)-like protein
MEHHLYVEPDRDEDGRSLPERGPVPLPRSLSGERIALGQALEARTAEIGQMVNRQFAVDLKGQVLVTAHLGAELIARWLITDRGATPEELRTLSMQGEDAMLEDAELASVAKAYFAWRDVTIAVLTEEARRLPVSEEVLALAANAVRFGCDGSLVRIVRQFDETRRSLQLRLSEEQARLAHRALHDELTGLPNRTVLSDRLRQSAQAQRRRPRGAMLLYLDLDNFKAINDRFGHAAGDCLLVEVAKRLQSLVRESDTVARLGGDEFVVLLDDLEDPEAAAEALAQRIHLSMRAPVEVGERQLHASISVGIASIGPDSDPEMSLAHADTAMYQAKRGGPARYQAYDSQSDADGRRTSELVHDLAVAYDLGQLSVHYQPVYKVGSGIVGMEALMRWRHPELGDVSPTEFIPMLERSREILPLGRWVLYEATRQCRAWQLDGQDELRLSINVSGRQLQDANFFDDLQDALSCSGLAADALIIEITEGALMVDMVRVGVVLQRVRDLGAHVALDDFGTGHSSLLYLRGLPINRLKVDRSFIAGLGSPGKDRTIVSTVVDLAHKLGLVVVAEGVETEAELRAVTAMGCDEVQGFLLDRPGPAVTFGCEHSLITIL